MILRARFWTLSMASSKCVGKPENTIEAYSKVDLINEQKTLTMSGGGTPHRLSFLKAYNLRLAFLITWSQCFAHVKSSDI